LEGKTNFFENLAYLNVILNDLLQGKILNTRQRKRLRLTPPTRNMLYQKKKIRVDNGG